MDGWDGVTARKIHELAEGRAGQCDLPNTQSVEHLHAVLGHIAVTLRSREAYHPHRNIAEDVTSQSSKASLERKRGSSWENLKTMSVSSDVYEYESAGQVRRISITDWPSSYPTVVGAGEAVDTDLTLPSIALDGKDMPGFPVLTLRF